MTSVTVCLAGVVGGERVATQQVLPVRALDQVLRTDAPTMKTVSTRGGAFSGHMAKVIERTERRGAGEVLIGPDVRPDMPVTIMELPVPVVGKGSDPEPASAGSFLNLGFEPEERVSTRATDDRHA